MSDNSDLRLIEDYLPIEAISAEASREKSVRKGHISTLHLWWARRPLVACRAAVYGALVPADRWVKDIEMKNPPTDPAKAEATKNGKKKGLNRKAAKDFVTKLCRYPKTDPKAEKDIKVKEETERAIVEAQRHILEAHADRLTAELAEAKETGKPPAWVEEFKFQGDKVSYDDIVAGRAPRPRVLDMFAGGGAIPLEALRLGCEAYALDLNPVAHIIELCTLVYPQKYGKPDPNARGMTGLPAPQRFWAYVIRCEDDSFYIGQTDNIVRRYDDHRSGKAEWTAAHKPVELIHWEEFKTRDEAVAREHELKSGFGRRWLKREWSAGRLALRQAGPKNANGLPASLEGLAQPGETTWGGLAAEVRYWGNWVLDRVRKEIGDLYPPIPDPEVWNEPPEIAFDHDTGQWNVTKPGKPKKGVKIEPAATTAKTAKMFDDEEDEDEGESPRSAVTLPPGFLQPVAYLWTRTVRCKNPSCGATVPLARQTWLCKKAKRYVALKMLAPTKAKEVRFEVVESETEKGVGFDPAGFSKAGNATCPFCGTVADNDYVKAEGRAGRMASQPMAVVCTRPARSGRVYVGPGGLPPKCSPGDETIHRHIGAACRDTGLTIPDETIEINPRSMDVDRWGLTRFSDLFSARQMLSLLTFTAAILGANDELASSSPDHAKAVVSLLACYVDRCADHWSSLCAWNPVGQKLQHTFGRQSLPMVWDYAEAHPWGGSVGDWIAIVENGENGISTGSTCGFAGRVCRGSATTQPYQTGLVDAVITDPPYYDNVSYSNLADFFYVWLKRTAGHLYPEHFTTMLTPKKAEVIAAFYRHGDSKPAARGAYEEMMAQSLVEAHRVLKPGGTLAVVYAHKTTLGWSTLVDAFRKSGFTVTEAWPLDTEMKTRLIAMDTAALASSIFLVGRKRAPGSGVGNYEDDIQPELQQIVRERVETLWDMGIGGADLVIACVGAGLRAFTKYEKVEYANGEEVPAEKFLAEVEAVVLDTMLARLSGTVGGNVSAVDSGSRFYVLWRYVYKTMELDAGEAIVFSNGTHIELDGSHGLSAGKDALIEKKKAKYRARDFTERGEYERLGMPSESQPGAAVPLIDVLHRILWLMENSPRKLAEFLDEARPDRERLRVLAQALAGAALSGKSEADAAKLVTTTTAEQTALGKLLANWRSLIEEGVAAAVVGKKAAKQDKEDKQRMLDFGKGNRQ
ncbi:MAG TPA: DUF1156 domain-containing protein [Sedimentisphaerales bacterium]|jgi:putative DNA methylase|nr:DUF1156 domain-containing protein [Sedimentisphaerales bacterium]HNU31484.1 DUF1156 domain-containing protein [Sedimentisphaerales bacterium]